MITNALACVPPFIAAVVGGYDLAIVVLTVAFYLLLAPFAYVGQRTIHQIQQAQPAIGELRRRFKGDRRELNRALLVLYRDRGIRPARFLFGWIPMVAQALMGIVLYLHLLSLPHSEMDRFIIPWLDSSSIADRTYVLPLLLGLVLGLEWHLTRKLNPPGASIGKAALMLALPIVPTLVATVLPAGVTLFTLTTAMLMTAKDLVVMRWLDSGQFRG